MGLDAQVSKKVTARAELTAAEDGDSALVGLSTKLDEDTILYGTYTMSPRSPFGPTHAEWMYTAPQRRSFSADFISGAHRLANGNTFICSGPTGRFFEVTPEGAIVWEYLNPYRGTAPNPAGDPPYSVFRATLIPADHPALVGRQLEAGD